MQALKGPRIEREPLTMAGLLNADDALGPGSSPERAVLLVGRDGRLAAFLDRSLSAAGYRVGQAADAQAARRDFDTDPPDLVLVDVGLREIDGAEVARLLRAQTSVPIVLLGAGVQVADRVAALDAGADDYLTKPVVVDELLARIRALWRGRALAAAGAIASTRHGTLTFADVCLDLDSRQAFRAGRRLELRNKTFELLAFFLRQPERVLSRRELLEGVWGYEFLGASNVIEVTVGHVRHALEVHGEPRLIQTVRPVGYMLRARPSP